MQNLKIAALIVAGAAFGVTFAQAQATENSEGAGSRQKAYLERLCSEQGEPAYQGKFAERLAEYLNLTDAQKAAFKDVQDTRAKSRSDWKASICASEPDLSSLEGRLAFRESRLEARLAAVKAEDPKLLAFYNTLDEGQKAKFDKIYGSREHHHPR
jgi:hypothetical protein